VKLIIGFAVGLACLGSMALAAVGGLVWFIRQLAKGED